MAEDASGSVGAEATRRVAELTIRLSQGETKTWELRYD